VSASLRVLPLYVDNLVHVRSARYPLIAIAGPPAGARAVRVVSLNGSLRQPSPARRMLSVFRAHRPPRADPAPGPLCRSCPSPRPRKLAQALTRDVSTQQAPPNEMLPLLPKRKKPRSTPRTGAPLRERWTPGTRRIEVLMPVVGRAC
jgi:hypothetical protein